MKIQFRAVNSAMDVQATITPTSEEISRAEKFFDKSKAKKSSFFFDPMDKEIPVWLDGRFKSPLHERRNLSVWLREAFAGEIAEISHIPLTDGGLNEGIFLNHNDTYCFNASLARLFTAETVIFRPEFMNYDNMVRFARVCGAAMRAFEMSAMGQRFDTIRISVE